MLVDKIVKFSAYVGLDVFAVCWVEPGNIAMTLASVRREILGRFAVLIREVRAEVAAVEGFLVWWNCFLKGWGIAKEF